MPDFSLESALAAPVAGVDEAGRGPWAGPVVAAAVILHPGRVPDGIDDSKSLPRRRREELFVLLHRDAICAAGIASMEEIDRLNILGAAMLAMRRAVDALAVAPAHALVDGDRLPDLPCPARAVVRGDTLSLSIAAASIVAKVTRDRMMAELAERYPAYGWERNSGYGTARHREAIALHGITPYHRRSFAPIRAALQMKTAREKARESA